MKKRWTAPQDLSAYVLDDTESLVADSIKNMERVLEQRYKLLDFAVLWLKCKDIEIEQMNLRQFPDQLYIDGGERLLYELCGGPYTVRLYCDVSKTAEYVWSYAHRLSFSPEE